MMNTHMHLYVQPSLNELPATTPPTSSSPPPSYDGRERKRPAAVSDENTDPESKPPKLKQPRTIEIELPPSTNESQDTAGICNYDNNIICILAYHKPQNYVIIELIILTW